MSIDATIKKGGYAVLAALAFFVARPAFAATATPSPLTCTFDAGTLTCPTSTITSGAGNWAAFLVNFSAVSSSGTYHGAWNGSSYAFLFSSTTGSPASSVPGADTVFPDELDLETVGAVGCEDIDYLQISTAIGSAEGVLTDNGANIQYLAVPGGVCGPSGPPDPREEPDTRIVSPAFDIAGPASTFEAETFTVTAASDVATDDYPDEEDATVQFAAYDQDGFVLAWFDEVAAVATYDGSQMVWGATVHPDLDFEDGHQYEFSAKTCFAGFDCGPLSDVPRTITASTTLVQPGADYFTISGEADACAAEQGDLDENEDGELSIFEALQGVIPSFLNSIKEFLWVGCDTFSPISDLVAVMRQHAPFKQAIWVYDTIKQAINDTEATGNISVKMPPPWDCDEGCDLVLFDPQGVYDIFGGDDGWGDTVRTSIAALTLIGLAFYFYHEARTLL